MKHYNAFKGVRKGIWSVRERPIQKEMHKPKYMEPTREGNKAFPVSRILKNVTTNPITSTKNNS